MKVFLYSIYDGVAKTYTTPFALVNKGVAIRSLEAKVNDKEPNNISDSPLDYTLFEIGTFNDQTAEVEMYTVAEKVINASALKQQNKPEDIMKALEELKEVITEVKKLADK